MHTAHKIKLGRKTALGSDIDSHLSSIHPNRALLFSSRARASFPSKKMAAYDMQVRGHRRVNQRQAGDTPDRPQDGGRDWVRRPSEPGRRRGLEERERKRGWDGKDGGKASMEQRSAEGPAGFDQWGKKKTQKDNFAISRNVTEEHLWESRYSFDS